ncbi:MAG: hypothetical protein GY910_08590 [bacterium]|nr:hypothetical protein [Deltaproteobacteria bacterium]MCP4905026.1 hypothetical protein [bacterium]
MTAPDPPPTRPSPPDADGPSQSDAKGSAPWQRLLPWAITIICFGYLYTRLSGAAARDGLGLIEYLAGVFARVSWGRWLALMIPYSAFFFLVDSLIVWRVVSWFNTPVRYSAILPIRGSSYILSILNEQVGKGAMGIYLNRRYGVPGWEVGSSMIFIMFCEFFYLLGWATIGWSLRSDELPEVFGLIPWIASGAAIFLCAWLLFFRGPLGSGVQLRERPLFKSFREAGALRYLTIVVLRSPALLAAVVVYTYALDLFGVDTNMGQMLGYLPVIFFGAATPGPMRTVAITLWVILFPGNEGEMAAFGFVQHNFFIFFNAAIGLLFLSRANRELFAGERGEEVAAD